jgi:hypothetical protein
MKKINCWDDLAPFGIEILTAEACGLSYRYLCDVTEKGRKVLSVAFGIPNFSLAEAWNRGTDAAPHVGSIMLSQCMLTPAGVFALLESGCTEVWLHKNGVLLGVEPGDRPADIAVWKDFSKDEVVRKFSYGGTAGSRNQHVMSGRIE